MPYVSGSIIVIGLPGCQVESLTKKDTVKFIVRYARNLLFWTVRL